MVAEALGVVDVAEPWRVVGKRHIHEQAFRGVAAQHDVVPIRDFAREDRERRAEDLACLVVLLENPQDVCVARPRGAPSSPGHCDEPSDPVSGPVPNAYHLRRARTRAHARQVVVPHLIHDGSALLRPAPQRRSLPLCSDPRRVLRVSPSSRRGTRVRPRRQRWSNQEAERPTASACDRRVRAARAPGASAGITVGGAPRVGDHRRRGSGDDPPCAARGRHQHHPRDMGNVHLSGVREGIPAGDLRSGSRSEDQGGRDVAQRRTRSRR